MTGRLIMVWFRDTRRGIVYTTSGSDAEAMSWQFAYASGVLPGGHS